jgi:uncharacterized protein Yka (UPF0111/DUF47 family)
MAGGDMKRGHWFLPESPDVLGLLRAQLAVTIDGTDAFAAWAGGHGAAVESLHAAQPRGETAKRDVLAAVRDAFITPLEPEDLFALSSGIDWILDYLVDLVNEAEVMDSGPDGGIAEMAGKLGDAMRRIDEAIGLLGTDGTRASEAADAAIAAERELERAYYRGMAALLEVQDMRDRIARRELYRRCARIGERVIDVAERVIYAVMKAS